MACPILVDSCDENDFRSLEMVVIFGSTELEGLCSW